MIHFGDFREDRIFIIHLRRKILHIFIYYIVNIKNVIISHFCKMWSSVFFDDFSCCEILLPIFHASIDSSFIYGWKYFADRVCLYVPHIIGYSVDVVLKSRHWLVSVMGTWCILC